MTFTREDVSIDELVTELKQALSDDGLLSQHLGYTHPVRSMVTPVEVAGDLRTVIHRQIRFGRLTHVREGMYDAVFVGLGIVAVAVLRPFVTALVVTGLAAGVYAVLGVRRWTFLLAFPGIVVVPLTALLGITRTEFEWAGRRYRLNDPKDVKIIENNFES